MRPELDEILCKYFPLLYTNRHASIMETCMAWGFECGDGWFQLIYNLSAKLEALIWKFAEDNPNSEYLPCASQVKEKYGTLRFYMDFETKEMSDLISEAENLSGKVCDVCGGPGKRRGDGWVSTRCEEHR